MPLTDHEDIKNIKTRSRLFKLISYRIIIITLFLGITIFVDLKKQDFAISQITLNMVYIVALAIYFFSIVYILVFKFIEDLTKNIYLQMAVDVILITALIFVTGNIQIDYSLFYTLVIIYSVIFIGRKGGLIVASVASIFYGLFVNIQFHELVSFVPSVKYYSVNQIDVLNNLLLHIVSFYILAFLASFVVEQEKKTRSLLEEKESEFNQLDLLFRSIVESVYTGVMTVDLQGTIKTFNRAAEEITGFPRSSIQNLKVKEVFPGLLPFLNEETMNEQIKSRIEVVIMGKAENDINLGLSVSPLKGKHDKQIGNILIFQDLTKIKQMESKLEKSKNLALIGEMAAGLAHEIRNPLSAITGSIELLKQELQSDGTDRRLMEIILRGKDQLESFARDFLLLSRPIPVVREPVDINQVVQEVLDFIKLNKDWAVKIKILKDLADDVVALANKEQVRQIVNNLVINAIHAMEEGGVLSIETKTVTLDDQKEYAEIVISDTGCGIEEKDLQRIFEPFFTKKAKGTGLGLSIVNHIVDGYEGKINMESYVNQGTTCTVYLPVNREKHTQEI